MEHITTGHWIFAAISLTAFLIYLVWSYRKDAGTHRKFYRGTSWILLVAVMVFMAIFVFKRLF